MNNTMIDQNCPICRENKPEMFKIWFDGYVKLYKCKACGFVAQYPGPGTYTVRKDYKDRYSSTKNYIKPQKLRNFQNILERIMVYKPNGRILDIGCGNGHFLKLCSNNNYECFGVEGSQTRAEYAVQNTNAVINQGLYQQKMFPENHFDIISLIQVLEHIPDPNQTLQIIKYHLKDNGMLVIEVPSITAPHFLAYRWTRIKKFVQPPKGVIYSHCNYFSPNSLATLVENRGFKATEMITGRWQHKYTGLMGKTSKIIDPLLNAMRVGGILYLGKNVEK